MKSLNNLYGKGNWRIVQGELHLRGIVRNSTVPYWFLAPKNIYLSAKSST